MTIRDFAALCGVSPATVSRYFSGQETVGQQARARIEEGIRKTGYRPPETYRTRRKPNPTIVVLLPRLGPAFFSDAVSALQEQAEALGKRLVILLMSAAAPRATLQQLQALRPLGVILLHESKVDPIADALSERGIPTVVCGALAMGRRFSTVHIDDTMAAYDGMNYLISLGHREIGVLSDDNRAISSGFQRLTGCRKAMEDARLTLSEALVSREGMSFDAGYRGMQQLLSRAPGLTAVFAFSDEAAAGAIACLYDAGKRVPEDVSVLGFDDNSLAERLRPRLTTVHQPIRAIAKKSLERLLAIEGAHDMASLTLPCRIAERDSCRPPRPEPPQSGAAERG